MRIAAIVASAACALAASTIAFGQTYPAKPIRIIAPFPPGGSVDLVARVLANELAKPLGQQVAGGFVVIDYFDAVTVLDPHGQTAPDIAAASDHDAFDRPLQVTQLA